MKKEKVPPPRPMDEIKAQWKKEHGNEMSAYEEEFIKFLQTRPLCYASVKHVTGSGMVRWINFYVVRDGKIERLNFFMEALGVAKRDRRYDDALKVSGCGMDMCFAMLYNFSGYLFKSTNSFDACSVLSQNYKYL